MVALELAHSGHGEGKEAHKEAKRAERRATETAARKAEAEAQLAVAQLEVGSSHRLALAHTHGLLRIDAHDHCLRLGHGQQCPRSISNAFNACGALDALL